MKWTGRILVGCSILFSILAISPFFREIVFPDKFSSLAEVFKSEGLKTYYSILGVIVSGCVGIAGVGFGFFYFSNSRRRSVIDNLISKLESLDLGARTIFEGNFASQRELTQARHHTSALIDDILAILFSNEHQMSTADQSKFLKLYAYLDKNRIFKEYSLRRIRRVKEWDAQEDYLELIRDLKLTFVKCRQ